MTTRSPEKAQVLSCHGMSAGAWNRYGKEGSWRYDIEEPGYKYNMFDIQAALALTQLSRMEDMQRRRFEAVEVYQQAFADVPELRLQKTPDYCHHSRHLYVLRIVPERLTISRDQFIEELESAQRRRERALYCFAHDERVCQALWL